MSIFSYFKQEKVKRPLRDKDGRAYYLKKLPLYQQYPRVTVGVGLVVSFLVFFSAPLYHTFFATPREFTSQEGWWEHERVRGIRDVDLWRLKHEKAGKGASVRQIFEARPDLNNVRKEL